MRKIAIVINPISGGGRGRKIWRILQPGLNALFNDMVYRMSNRLDDLTSITRSLLAENPDYLLVIGGDGTLNHALNGMIFEDKLTNPNTKIAYFNAGCGGDFARLFPPQKITEFLDRLIHNESIVSNLGKITLGEGKSHYFINIASCGLSGQVVLDTAKSTWFKKLGGPINYFVHSFLDLLTYRQSTVRIQLDDKPSFESSLLMMAVCNGQYFGGKMHVAPSAKIDDGVFDVVLFQDFSLFNAMIKLPKIYSGGHLLEANVHYAQAKKVSIEPINQVIVEVEADGESIGPLPAVFELLTENVALIV